MERGAFFLAVARGWVKPEGRWCFSLDLALKEGYISEGDYRKAMEEWEKLKAQIPDDEPLDREVFNKVMEMITRDLEAGKLRGMREDLKQEIIFL